MKAVDHMEWGVVAAVAAGVALLFGVKKIPEFARNIGRAQGEFKKGLREGVVDEDSPIATFNEHVAADPRSVQVLLSVRDGMTLIRRA